MTILADKIVYDTEESAIECILSGTSDLEEMDQFGFRPLIQAVICQKTEVLQLLISKGINLEQIDLLGRTALQWASDRGEIDYCQLLLSAGANPNHHSADGQPILVNPILREQLEIVDLFLSYGVDYEFAQDFISAKLLGHRFELTGETDIVSPDHKFIPLSYEGFYLEFSTGLIKRSLNNFINSIEGQNFEEYHGKLNKALKALENSAVLASFAKHKDKTSFKDNINKILSNDLLLIPAAYKGHAITFIKYKNLWIKCDRGVGKIVDTVVVSEIGNLNGLTQDLYYKLLYETKSEDFVKHEIKEILNLQPIDSLPTKAQVTGNCSWANVETSVPAMIYMLSTAHLQNDRLAVSNEVKKIYKLYEAWVSWDKDTSLEEVLEDFQNADLPRQISKAMILGSILVQRCRVENKSEVKRASKILNILVLDNFKFILEGYIRRYLAPSSGLVGKSVINLLKTCGLDLKKIKLNKKENNRKTNVETNNLVKMTTALHVACLNNKLHMVKYILEKTGIEVDYPDRTGSTALMYAAWKGNLEIVKFLIEKYKSNPNIKNLKGGTALDYAKYAKKTNVVEYLLNIKIYL